VTAAEAVVVAAGVVESRHPARRSAGDAVAALRVVQVIPAALAGAAVGTGKLVPN